LHTSLHQAANFGEDFISGNEPGGSAIDRGDAAVDLFAPSRFRLSVNLLPGKCNAWPSGVIGCRCRQRPAQPGSGDAFCNAPTHCALVHPADAEVEPVRLLAAHRQLVPMALGQRVPARLVEVMRDHSGAHLAHADPGLPGELLARPRGVGEQRLDFGGAEAAQCRVPARTAGRSGARCAARGPRRYRLAHAVVRVGRAATE